ncbi:hypothetical protein BN7_482 [Wickerhamomyces ciferrii]|uniref:Uncharacterized protein n=1 Tax=Wickerhamomyces ciferrii (strain ATCC 14091 / BCRC 22168 / CBS 111 / JCM 3599 / NBRC 0793 / NRRL Y-1031 F-60-10) TaxID=1206466 RepID=K0KIG2_WICCF|nr:uncharacterized protein BN7_482 [Wickerhamomyces ciferrii]CCH40948.1 hypothetical protein BN7_482 [Wickerhamomyces ciferrii]
MTKAQPISNPIIPDFDIPKKSSTKLKLTQKSNSKTTTKQDTNTKTTPLVKPHDTNKPQPTNTNLLTGYSSSESDSE